MTSSHRTQNNGLPESKEEAKEEEALEKKKKKKRDEGTSLKIHM